MADVTVTAANVVPAAGATLEKVTAGATITAGQVVYKDTTDANKVKLADADAQATALVAGIAVGGAANNQPLFIVTKGDISFGAIFTAGHTFCASTTPGGIAPEADLLTGDFKSILGVTTSTSNLRVNLINRNTAEG